MKKEFVDPFIKILPSIDLHGETGDAAVWLLDSFLTVNIKMHKEKVAVIHGKGKGIVKKRVHEFLAKDKRILKYYVYGSNDGLTIVELKKDVD